MTTATRPSSFSTVALLGTWLATGVLAIGDGAARAAVTWRGDFETGDISQFTWPINATLGTRKNIEIVADPVQQGKSAARFTIHADDTYLATQMRVQISREKSPTAEGQDVFLSFYFYLDQEPMVRADLAYWESQASFHNMMTWWLMPNDGGRTTLNFGTGDLGSKKHIYTGAITVREWHQVAFDVHWSKDPQLGNIKFWVDGKQVVDEKAQTKPDDNIMFFQAGIHRANRSTLTDTVFYDNFIEGTSLADVLSSPTSGIPDGGSSDSSDDSVGADAPGDLVAAGPTATGGSGGSLPPDRDGSGSGGATGTTGTTGNVPSGHGPGAVTSGGCTISPSVPTVSPSVSSFNGLVAFLLCALLALVRKKVRPFSGAEDRQRRRECARY